MKEVLGFETRLEQLFKNIQELDLKTVAERLTLVRHGKTRFDGTGTLKGSIDIPMLSSERTVIKKQAEALFGKYCCRDNTVLVSSGLLRAQDTARVYQEVGGFPEIIIMTDFNEMSFGSWEGKPNQTLQSDNNHKLFMQNPILAAQYNIPPSGENFIDFLNRVLRGTNTLLERDKNIILITHSGVIRALRFFFISQGVETTEKLKQAGTNFFLKGGDLIPIPHGSLKFLCSEEEPLQLLQD